MIKLFVLPVMNQKQIKTTCRGKMNKHEDFKTAMLGNVSNNLNQKLTVENLKLN